LFKTEPQTDPLIGRKLDGRYDVLARLGEGGIGVVYRARQAHLGRFVAIKVLHQDAAAIPEWRRRFEREARALSALAHPNVVPVTDSGIDGGVPFLVMELLQGKTLAELIKEGPLPPARGLDIVRQTLRGLAFAHGKGIVHRDLKPANVFLQALPDQTDHVRLLDFGMVKFLEGAGSRTMSEALTRVGVAFGTPAYMSPEQAKGAPADERTDVYTAGALLFELLAGRRPFLNDTAEGVVIAHLTEPVPSLAKLRPDLTVASLFQPVVERAMAKKPAARFKDAGAMLAALDAVIAKLPPGALGDGRGGRAGGRRKPTPRTVNLTPSSSRLPRRALTLVVLGAGLAAAGMYFRTIVRHDRATRVETARPAEPAKALPAARASASPSAPPKPSPAAEPPPASTTPAPPSKPTLAAEPPTSALPAAPPKPERPTPSPAEARAPATAEEDKPAAPAEAPKPAQAGKAEPHGQQGDDSQPRSRARNPWREPVPRTLRPIRDRLDRGAHLSQRALRPAYDFAHGNPGDPRPWLLLGRAYAQLDWLSDSVDRYVHADQVDSSSRGDPQMLSDLLKAAAHPVAGRVAARAIHDIYGAEALPALNKAIERGGSDREAAARLTRLRESLQR
jgi:serine/threonine-protein kinase